MTSNQPTDAARELEQARIDLTLAQAAADVRAARIELLTAAIKEALAYVPVPSRQYDILFGVLTGDWPPKQ